MKLDSATVLATTVAVVLIFWPRPGLAGRDHLNRYNYKTDQMTPQVAASNHCPQCAQKDSASSPAWPLMAATSAVSKSPSRVFI
jgi:hypothetical protein